MAIWSKIKIEDENVDEFLEKFCAGQSPPIVDGKPMAPVKWWRLCNKNWNLNTYRAGKKKLANVDVNEDIVKAG